MRNPSIKKISLLAALLTLSVTTFSQHGNPLQFLKDVSQSSTINPAFQNTTNKLVVGLPVIGGTRANWNANFTIKNIPKNDAPFDYQNFYNALDEYGDAFSLAQVPVIFVSLKKNNRTFSFSLSERFIGTANFNSEIVNFFAQGLQPYYGKNENVGPFTIKSQYYREIAVGYSHEIWEGFNLGIRPKLLFGKFYYHTQIEEFMVNTDAESELLLVKPEGKVTISGPVKVVLDPLTQNSSIKPDMKASDYFFKPVNMGSSIDLGFTYKLNKESEISASILDLGFTSINYKSYDITYNDALRYEKDNLYQSHDPEAPNYWSPQFAVRTMTKSFPEITDVTASSKKIYEMLPLQVNAQLNYILPSKLKLGVANHYTFYKKHSSNFFTGFIHKPLSDKFAAAATLNLYNLNTFMPGIGGSYTGESVQYYLSTNNIMALIRPTSVKNINLCFGVNFLFSTD